MTMTISGGTVISAAGERRADVVVEDGVIAGVGDVETHGEVVDASGLLVLPGMVDTHVHLMDPGDTKREDYPTGTRAGAARGVTTIVEHTHASPIRGPDDLRERRSHLEGRSNIDYGLAAHVWPDRIGDIPALHQGGITFFKIFTCDTHGVPGLDSAILIEALRALSRVDGRCLIHNEDQTLTANAESRLKEEDRLDPGLIVEWRSREAELIATDSTATSVLNTGAKATFAHVSNPAVLDVIAAFQSLGADIAAEACPQYFILAEDEVETEGALRKFTPPARIRTELDRDAMWAAVSEHRFSHFSTDHAPATLAQKAVGGIWDAPFGLPGLDTTMPFLLDAALSGRMTMSDVVRLYSTAPARRYQLPKGVIQVGVQADIVLVDPHGSWTVQDEDIISKAGWSPYSGHTFKGRVVATYLRGEEIARDGKCHDLRSGHFVRPTP